MLKILPIITRTICQDHQITMKEIALYTVMKRMKKSRVRVDK